MEEWNKYLLSIYVCENIVFKVVHKHSAHYCKQSSGITSICNYFLLPIL